MRMKSHANASCPLLHHIRPQLFPTNHKHRFRFASVILEIRFSGLVFSHPIFHLHYLLDRRWCDRSAVDLLLLLRLLFICCSVLGTTWNSSGRCRRCRHMTTLPAGRSPLPQRRHCSTFSMRPKVLLTLALFCCLSRDVLSRPDNNVIGPAKGELETTTFNKEEVTLAPGSESGSTSEEGITHPMNELFDEDVNPTVTLNYDDDAVALSTDAPGHEEEAYEELLKRQEHTAGIYFRVSQKGVDYVTGLASEALPQLLDRLVLPKIEESVLTISKLMIEKFEKPSIQARFIGGKGVGANIFLPEVKLGAAYQAQLGFFGQSGRCRAQVKNLTIEMEVHISRNESEKRNIVEVPVCNVTTSSVKVAFAGDSSTSLNAIRSTIQTRIAEEIANAICQISVQITEFFENEKRQVLKPKKPVEEEGEEVEESDVTAGADSFGADLCAPEKVEGVEDEPEVTTLAPTGDSGRVILGGPPKKGQWAMDLTLRYPITFTDNDVVFGLDGGAVFFGSPAQGIIRPAMLNVSAMGDKMVGFLISEYVPNTFFDHIYENNLGIIKETLRMDSLPKYLRPIAKLVCSTCQLQLTANLTGQPHMTITQKGATMDIEGDVSVVFASKTKNHNVINANTKLKITVRPYVRQSRVYGDVSLTNVDIRAEKVGIGGIFANSLRKMLNFVVPKRLWPKIKKRLRFALNDREPLGRIISRLVGFKLPVMCGLELEKLSVDYIEHAIVLDTDFTYDLPHFITKFKAHMANELKKAKESSSEEDTFRYL
ncbi:hypothetical protein L596_022369 [Steinernema carpocapsae]|uniref:Lipid-binding serum glycoprotein C-terminal domain-containing protein n=1 Tax=Steinernema carpocapsae TaxID=34508 RepID=A0A4U5MLG1_STECR|nr:hypothetical protein L596_022369 [Steinernema carpocapsae]